LTSAYTADPVFEATSKQIAYLLQQIDHGSVALPDFQRSFVWETRRTLELLRSVMSRFPTGTLLFWRQSDGSSDFAERQFEDAPVREGKADELVLDGQQRLTALYRALTPASDEMYFVRLEEFLGENGDVKAAHEVDFERALFCVERGGKMAFDPNDTIWQFDEGAFLLSDLDAFDEWLDRFARHRTDDVDEERVLKKSMRDVRNAYLVPLRSYGFPVVSLPSSTPLEAVCNIFESLNRSGRMLGAFELLTARFYPGNVNLRELWAGAVDQYEVLQEFGVDPYDLLQVISLRVNNSAQRSDVLAKLEPLDIREHWSQAVSGVSAVLDLLKTEHGVLQRRWLSYGMILVPMAAVWSEIRALKPLPRGQALERLFQYYWCSTFMSDYDQGANSQAGADYILLKNWVKDGSARAPGAVAGFHFDEAVLQSASVRRKSLHAGVMALTIRAGAKDFHSAQALTTARMVEKKIDSHHIFPKAYLTSQAMAGSELLLNRALIDSETNKIIGKRSPSDYLEIMRSSYGEEKMSEVLESHAIPADADSGLLTNNFDDFIYSRSEAVVALMEAATGKTVDRAVREPAVAPKAS